jgi:hypothetical protein
MSAYSGASLSHHDAVVSLLKKDTEFAEEYLKQTLEEDANDPKTLSMALRHLAEAMGVDWLTRKLACMSNTVSIQNKIEFLENRITQLDNVSYASLRDWFLEFDQARWHHEIQGNQTLEESISP